MCFARRATGDHCCCPLSTSPPPLRRRAAALPRRASLQVIAAPQARPLKLGGAERKAPIRKEQPSIGGGGVGAGEGGSDECGALEGTTADSGESGREVQPRKGGATSKRVITDSGESGGEGEGGQGGATTEASNWDCDEGGGKCELDYRCAVVESAFPEGGEAEGGGKD